MISAIRYHDISCGHRVVGHEGKCRNLHGHNYRIHFYCQGALDSLGRVIDFGIIKSTLCQWLEEEWDHRMIISSFDPLARSLRNIDPTIVVVDFNPTAENMAEYLLKIMAPTLLEGTGVQVVKVIVEETRKCSVEVTL